LPPKFAEQLYRQDDQVGSGKDGSSNRPGNEKERNRAMVIGQPSGPPKRTQPLCQNGHAKNIIMPLNDGDNQVPLSMQTYTETLNNKNFVINSYH